MANIADLTFNSNPGTPFGFTSVSGADISVAAAAGLAGTPYGLNILIDDTTGDYGRVDDLNNTSGLLRVRFYFKHNALAMSESNYCDMLGIKNSSFVVLGYCPLYYASGSHRIKPFIYNDSGVSSSPTSVIIETDKEYFVELKYTKASAVDVPDGKMEWWLDGAAQASVTGIQLYTRWSNVDIIDLGNGCVNATPATVTGTVFLDELKANDDGGEIGPVGAGTALNINICPANNYAQGVRIYP